MQTASSKILLAEFGASTQRLAVGQSLEKVVSHEIKELGQHVLGCIVSYRMPPGMRPPPGQPTDAQDPSVQSFRKFYKFAVSTLCPVECKHRMLERYLGYQPPLREDQSSSAPLAYCSSIKSGTREGVSRGSYPEPHPGRYVA